MSVNCFALAGPGADGVLIDSGGGGFAYIVGGAAADGQICDLQLCVQPISWEGQHREACEMAKGTVKWFNATKGYGFIQPQGGGGKDVFVHISAVERAGLSSLNEGQIVEYEEVPNKGKTSAENLKVQR